MDIDPRLHFVAITAIIYKDGKFLISKRAASEKAFPNKWTVPGGKMVFTEYSHLPRTSPTHPQWYNVVEFVLRKEVREEVGLEIEKPQYLTDLVFVRPDGYPVVTLSYWAHYKSGEVRLNHEMSEFAWVTAEEAKKYDLIEGIAEEIEDADKIIKASKR
ncbi:MAG: NUDIX domain-containing protein [Minisyncoccia bacterium]|jgi:8-oxo-dGTP pyrophosphatase MutT (NUDIX family)